MTDYRGLLYCLVSWTELLGIKERHLVILDISNPSNLNQRKLHVTTINPKDIRGMEMILWHKGDPRLRL